MQRNIHLAIVTLVGLMMSTAAMGESLLPIDKRFKSADVQESPDFQKHISPLFGRLGCNGRACHGSFQGRGGFHLSLFGYDFKADHVALHENGRVDPENALESLIIAKPTDEDEHEGGLRYETDSWQYHVIRRWIESGAQFDENALHKLERLEVVPSEIVFKKKGEKVQLKAIAHWADGSMEDVTPLCRFQSNNGEVAGIDENGLVMANKPGDTNLVVFYDKAVNPVPVMQPVTKLVGEKYPKVETPTKVDELVVEKLRKLGIVQSDLASDADFLRRVSLDMTGSLPTPDEIKKFLADESPNKRAKKIDELLESPAYAAWWTTKLCDFTGNNDYQLRNFLPQQRGYGNASQVWYDWIYKRVEKNAPYDDLVAGIVLAKSREEGESYKDYCEKMCNMFRPDSKETFADQEDMVLYWARREYRDAEPRAINFAYAFMGIRIQCAQCHKHPFDQWSKEDFAEFTNFFRTTVATNGRPQGREEQKEYNEIIAALDLDPKLRGGQARREFGRLMSEGKTVPVAEVYSNAGPRPTRGADAAKTDMKSAKLLGGEAHELVRGEDIREPLMAWLRGKDNPYFAKAFVNRVWASYFHRGIVDPPDDLSLANPPVNAALLDYLAEGFIESGFDMKWVHRTIANSRTYQLSWKPNDTNTSDETNFSRAVPRRLPAEVVYDALKQATGSHEEIAKMHEEMQGRAIAIPGASNRTNGRGGGDAAYALSVFGKSTRESNCDCDRATEPSLLQTVFMQNDQQIHTMIANSRGGWLNELAKQHGLRLQVASNSPGPRKPQNYEQIIERQRTYLANLKKQGKDEQAKKVKQKLKQMIARFGDPTPQTVEGDPAVAEGNGIDNVAIVQEAYLRTLSRFPDQRELQRSVEYMKSSPETMNNLQGLVWALLNTKEFIVNH